MSSSLLISKLYKLICASSNSHKAVPVIFLTISFVSLILTVILKYSLNSGIQTVLKSTILSHKLHNSLSFRYLCTVKDNELVAFILSLYIISVTELRLPIFL